MSILWRFGFIGKKPQREEVRDFVLSRMPSGGVCAEIGVFEGDFSARILRLSQPKRLYLIDPWYPHNPRFSDAEATYSAVRSRFADAIATGRVAVLREDSASAASRFPDATFDWIYIDGDHHYTAVRRDLKLYYPKVKPGGYIACDDYHYRGTWEDGVTRAVDEFMTLGLARKVYKRRSQFVMRKPHAIVAWIKRRISSGTGT
jgi:predicted O-methyltransferase YrrM